MIPTMLMMIVKTAIAQGGVFYPTNIHSLSQQILVRANPAVAIAALNLTSLTQQILMDDRNAVAKTAFRVTSLTQQLMTATTIDKALFRMNSITQQVMVKV